MMRILLLAALVVCLSVGSCASKAIHINTDGGERNPDAGIGNMDGRASNPDAVVGNMDGRTSNMEVGVSSIDGRIDVAVSAADSGGATDSGGTGGGISLTDPNVVAVSVDPGPPGVEYTNGLFADVTLCVPGTTTCQTIDHMLVSTGSVGVRVLKSEFMLALPAATSPIGSALAECLSFVAGSAWGPVMIADVRMGQEVAANLSIQVIGEATYPVPSDCTATPVNDLQSLGAKGILGIGIYLQDCGKSCAQPPGIPGLYYGCTSAQVGGCTATTVPLATQVSNPIAGFSVDNNGSFIRLPSIPDSGSTSVAGELVFGIGTRWNNGLGDAKVIAIDAKGFARTDFPVGGTQYTSYLDTSSNAVFFLNTSITQLPGCAGGLSSFYCPTSTVTLSASMPSIDGSNAKISFSVANAASLSAGAFAFSNLAGPMPGFPSNATVPGFDWGLPFYFGRTVFTSIESQNTPAGPGPYFAF
jgi:hypothetical protein